MVNRIATHASDVDGVASAALFLIKYPNVKIDFLKIGDLRFVQDIEYDYIVDLPKTANAKVNIDHHLSNYQNLKKKGMLKHTDVVDPKAPSAATLVIKYLDLEDNKIAQEIVKMAEKADTGNHDKNLIKLDLVIKCFNGDQEKLYKLAKIMAEKGKKVLKDPWVKSEWKRIEPHYKKGEKISKEIAKICKKGKIKNAIVDLKSGFPRIAFGSIAHQFLKNGGEVIAVVNRMTEEDNLCPPAQKREQEPQAKFSFRVNKNIEYDVRRIAEKLNGGGHIKASGGRVKLEEYPKALTYVLTEFLKRGKTGYFLVEEGEIKKI